MNQITRTFLSTLFLFGFSVSAFAERKEQIFEAKIVRIQMLGKFKGTAKLAAIDPRFVVELKLEKDIEGLGKKGAMIAFAIHSPARELSLLDYSSSVGQRIRLRLLEWQGAKRKNFSLRRALTKHQ